MCVDDEVPWDEYNLLWFIFQIMIFADLILPGLIETWIFFSHIFWPWLGQCCVSSGLSHSTRVLLSLPQNWSFL